MSVTAKVFYKIWRCNRQKCLNGANARRLPDSGHDANISKPFNVTNKLGTSNRLNLLKVKNMIVCKILTLFSKNQKNTFILSINEIYSQYIIMSEEKFRFSKFI